MILRMKITLNIIIVYLIVTVSPSSLFAFEDKKNVLLLHSFHTGYQWTDDITKAVLQTLNNNKQINLSIDYLDAERFFSLEYFSVQRQFLSHKYQDTSFDVILCADDRAFSFALANRTSLFSDIPIVFCGINSFEKEMLQEQVNITGVNETTDIKKTVELMMANHPETRNIHVINDRTLLGDSLKYEIIAISRQHPEVKWFFPAIYNKQQLQLQLSSLTKGDVVLLGAFSRDLSGDYIEPDETVELLSQNKDVPLYGLWDFYLGKGIVGGYLTSGWFQGESAAKIAMQIIDGQDADSIKVIMENPNSCKIDFNALQYYGVSMDGIPEDCEVINFPVSFYSENKKIIWAAILVIAFLSSISGLLAITLMRKRKVEADLRLLTTDLEDRVLNRTNELSRTNEIVIEREQEVQRMLSNLPGVVYRCADDECWTMMFLSEGIEKLTGYSADSLLQNNTLSYMDIIEKNDRARILEMVAEAITNKSHYILEYRIQTYDGKMKWVWEEGQGVYSENGEVLYLDGFITDISDRKIFEEQQAKLATAVHQTDDIVLITTSIGTIEYVNPAFENITGYSAAEVIGQNPRILKGGHQPSAFYEKMWEQLTNGLVFRGRVVNRRKDATEYVADVTISPIRNNDNKVTHYVGVEKDVTHEIVLEKQLQQAQKLEAMGTLAGGIAHEINTPTQFLNTNLEFIQSSFADLSEFLTYCIDYITLRSEADYSEKEQFKGIYDEKDVAYILEEIPLALTQSRDGTEKIAKIVGSMKQLSQPGGGAKTPAEINEMLQDSCILSGSEWKPVADITLDLANDLPMVLCLQSEISQVFLNIIINAAHAIESSLEGEKEKGMISISTKSVAGGIEVCIGDDGLGIPDTIKDRLFDPFFTTKDPGKGTGQGLSLSHTVIVEKHDGRISFESQEGIGTTFTIFIPHVEE